ncbi:unnamed protein product [Vitrella brassicaformis CCMP3155]|uniref:Lipid-binding serum glycoprotein N-terminal domain-containing protein n=1 Tax=Vitrella brassicaformis (strain CCMP3155) TaxID=1169540 RepID=A0A0G4ENF9_VITBC|nr:unnamed protein product [Vitrella brassicaformis CCMP3155]|eukprot:CEL98371.1 unnamed protein product [Vitrella brassicaformis CCMP3155]
MQISALLLSFIPPFVPPFVASQAAPGWSSLLGSYLARHRGLQSSTEASCEISSSPSLVQLVTNGILKEERDPVVLDDLGALTNTVILELDVGNFTMTVGPASANEIRVAGDDLYAKTRFHFDIRKSYFVDAGEGEAVATGAYAIDFGPDENVTCDFDRMEYEMELTSADWLLGALTAAGTETREGEIKRMVSRMLCRQVIKKVTGENLLDTPPPEIQLMSWYSSGFHYIFLALGLVVGFLLGMCGFVGYKRCKRSWAEAEVQGGGRGRGKGGAGDGLGMHNAIDAAGCSDGGGSGGSGGS